MNDQQQAAMATPHKTLIDEILDPRVPKNEREWAAAEEITALREALAQPQGDDDLTIAYMVGYEKGKDYMKEKAAKVCEELVNEDTCYVWIPDARAAVYNCAAAIRSMK